MRDFDDYLAAHEVTAWCDEHRCHVDPEEGCEACEAEHGDDEGLGYCAQCEALCEPIGDASEAVCADCLAAFDAAYEEWLAWRGAAQ